MSNLDVASENQLLSPYIEEIFLTAGQIVHKSGETTREIYFPQSAVFSIVVEMSHTSSSQVSLVENEGLVGLSAILSSDRL